jgi:hypothetical protein
MGSGAIALEGLHQSLSYGSEGILPGVSPPYPRTLPPPPPPPTGKAVAALVVALAYIPYVVVAFILQAILALAKCDGGAMRGAIRSTQGCDGGAMRGNVQHAGV